MESNNGISPEAAPLRIESRSLRYSHSKLKNQATCPARNWFSTLAYDGKIETDPAYPLVYGSAVHKGIEDALLKGVNPYNVAAEYVQENLLDKFPAKKLNAKTITAKWDLAQKCIKTFEERYYRDLMNSIEVAQVDPTTLVEVRLEVPFRQGILTGVVDFIHPVSGQFIDWKSGARVPSDDTLIRDPQAGIYYYLAKQLGIKVPHKFEYVYLAGKNIAQKRKEDGTVTADRTNPTMHYSFQVHQDDAKVIKLFAEYVEPLASQIEQGVLYKNPSEMNCNGCQYKTACWQTPLPSAKEAQEKMILDIIEMVDDE